MQAMKICNCKFTSQLHICMSATTICKFKSRRDSQDTYSCDQLTLCVGSLVGKFDSNFANFAGCLLLYSSVIVIGITLDYILRYIFVYVCLFMYISYTYTHTNKQV